MAKRKPMSFGTPKGEAGALDAIAERPDVIKAAVAEVTAPANDPVEKKKPKRDRKKLKSMNVWMSEEGRYAVKSHANNPSTGNGKETVESFVIRAINDLLAKEGSMALVAYEDE